MFVMAFTFAVNSATKQWMDSPEDVAFRHLMRFVSLSRWCVELVPETDTL